MFKTRRTRQLEQALAKLADACAQTLPGSAWSDEIDDALQLASYFVGPMGDPEPVPWRWVTRRRRQQAREDQAWADGYHLGEEETDEALAEKDEFISRQEAILVALVAGDFIKWENVSIELRDQLADYV